MAKDIASIHPPHVSDPLPLPFSGSKVPAGFPSPADDHMEPPLDLNAHLIQNPSATFLVRVAGHSMINAGIAPGDILVVDKSLDARHSSIVVAVVNGEFTLKRFRLRNGVAQLVSENPDSPPIDFEEGDELSIWGVVKHVIKDV
ncbi:MAG: translesion error-prone DNA polymerase V autoproteolytic subunit [Planctomycetes bacterium]|nr:translesion error-prone DNA polymerase V autoproteolytic subunit [Planctomycetota bacterium]